MCRKKPYPRCAYHARLKVAKAELSGDPQAIRKAKSDYFLTPTGIKDLKNKRLFKEAERFQARRNTIIRRIKEGLAEQEKTTAPVATTKSPAPAKKKPVDTTQYFGVLPQWELIEERARLNVGFYAGRHYDVANAGRRDSTNADIFVTNNKTGKSGYLEVKKVPSRAGLQAVLKEDKNGKFSPSDTKQGQWVQEICDIINSQPAGTVSLSASEQKQVNEIIVNHYKSKNIMGLMYTDAKGKDFALCAVDEIPDNVDIVLETPRRKESGSSPWPKRDMSMIKDIMERSGFKASDYTIEEQGKRSYVKFKNEPELGLKLSKNQSGYGVPEIDGVLPQLSSVEGTSLVYEIRKRSKTANPTVIIKLANPKNIVTRYPTRELERILSVLS